MGFRVVQMDNLRSLLGIRRIDIVPQAWVREPCRVTKGVIEKIDKSILQWFGHIERMGNDRIAKRVYVVGCMGSCLVGQLWKRWNDEVNEC